MKNLMPYKQNCKINNELAVKLSITKKYIDWVKPKKIIEEYWCSRNIPANLFKKFKFIYWDKWVSELRVISKIDSWTLEKFELLKWETRKPKTHNSWPPEDIEEQIVEIQKKHRYWMKRLNTHLRRQWKIDKKYLSLWKIKWIFKRYNLKTKRIRTANWNKRQQLYPYDELSAFEELNYDVKEIQDKKALPEKIYNLIKNNNEIPKYEFNIMCVKTKFRFMAYWYEKNAINGLNFLLYVLVYLRTFWIKTHITVQSDNWVEFWRWSEDNKELRNSYTKLLNAEFKTIPLWAKHLQNVIERSHRDDDEWFLCPRWDRFTNKDNFLKEADLWNFYRNNKRIHSWIWMNCTPLDKLEKNWILLAKHIANFPVMILEDYFQPLLGIKQVLDKVINDWYELDLNKNILLKNAQNVLTYYRIIL